MLNTFIFQHYQVYNPGMPQGIWASSNLQQNVLQGGPVYIRSMQADGTSLFIPQNAPPQAMQQHNRMFKNLSNSQTLQKFYFQLPPWLRHQPQLCRECRRKCSKNKSAPNCQPTFSLKSRNVTCYPQMFDRPFPRRQPGDSLR
jgi:hypothetical protein